MKTIAVIEGFAGGPRHTKLFRKKLKESGLVLTKSKNTADIIFAHSAGIYAISPQANAKLVILVGPTYWPGKSLLKSAQEHRKSHRSTYVSAYGWKFYLLKKTLEIYYFFVRHIYMWYGIFNKNRLDKINDINNKPGRKTIIIRNHLDPFTSSEIADELKSTSIKYYELPGIHDDYTVNPKPYIDILLKEL